jgi:hypothetical protein
MSSMECASTFNNCAKISTRRKLGTSCGSCCSVLEEPNLNWESSLSLFSATNFSIATFHLVPLLTIRLPFLLNNATLKSAALTSQENSKYPRTSETTPHSRISISAHECLLDAWNVMVVYLLETCFRSCFLICLRLNWFRSLLCGE